MSSTGSDVMARARRVRWLVLTLGRVVPFFLQGAVSDRAVLRRIVNKEHADFVLSTLFWFVDGYVRPPPTRPAVALNSSAQLSLSMRKRKAAVVKATKTQELLAELEQQLILFINGTAEEKQTLREWLVWNGWRIGNALSALQPPWDEGDVRHWRLFNHVREKWAELL
jgi:hypothetical protein